LENYDIENDSLEICPTAMNKTPKNNPHAEEDRFDRLVDGELSETDRRSLLSSLDARPDGWRRCALAFLEAQTFRESFGEFTPPGGTPSDKPAPVLSTPLPKRKKTFGAMQTAMLVSASFLLALGLGGWMLNQLPRGAAPTPGSNQIADNGLQPIHSQTPNVLANGCQTIPQPKTAETPWQYVSLHAPALTGNDEPLRLPAMPRERLDDEYLKTIPDPVPSNIRQAFERTGHVVRTNRVYVPVKLKDGRQLVVPVDQIDVKSEPNDLN
jgi:hypothetical protein